MRPARYYVEQEPAPRAMWINGVSENAMQTKHLPALWYVSEAKKIAERRIIPDLLALPCTPTQQGINAEVQPESTSELQTVIIEEMHQEAPGGV